MVANCQRSMSDVGYCATLPVNSLLATVTDVTDVHPTIQNEDNAQESRCKSTCTIFLKRKEGYSSILNHIVCIHIYGDFNSMSQIYLSFPLPMVQATTFLDPLDNEPAQPIQPRRGSVLLFTQNLLHEGSLVKSGIKYTMRTEAMYTR